MARYTYLYWDTPLYFKPYRCTVYMVREETVRECAKLYGWYTPNFYACIADDSSTEKVAVGFDPVECRELAERYGL